MEKTGLPLALLTLFLPHIALGQDVAPNPDGKKASRELAQYRAIAGRISTFRTNRKKLEDELSRLKKKKSDLKISKSIAKNALESKMNKEIGVLKGVQRREALKLGAEKTTIMAEYRTGVFCQGQNCGMTKSEYIKAGRLKEEPWDKHIARNGSKTVTTQMIQAKEAKLDRLIKKAWDRHERKIKALEKSFQNKIRSMNNRYDRRIAQVDRSIAAAKSARTKTIHQLKKARKDASAARVRYFNAVYREHTHIVSRRTRFRARKDTLSYEEQDLRAESPGGPDREARLRRIENAKNDLDRAWSQLEKEFRSRRTREHSDLGSAVRSIFGGASSIVSVDWMFDWNRTQNPTVKAPRPAFRRVISQKLESIAERFETKTKSLGDSLSRKWNRLPPKVEVDWRWVARKTLDSVMKSKPVEVGKELRKWVSNRALALHYTRKAIRDGFGRLLRGKSWRDLPPEMQEEADVWTSGTYDTMRSPWSGSLRKVHQYEDFMDVIDDQSDKWWHP